jgi:cytochrome c biogenesis protein CcmG/thiol:disulfide interchange protein DsbE
MKRWLPFAIFLILLAFFAIGLKRNPQEVPSPLIGKQVPDFNLPLLSDQTKSMKPADRLGQVWLLNVWASWCRSCREEHEMLLDLAKHGDVPIYGMDYKDKPEDAQEWLKSLGNPYTATVIDAEGRVGIDFGVYGVPETYVIDKTGVIRYKLIGPVTNENLQNKILPLVKELQK